MDIIHCNSCSHVPQIPGMGHRRYFLSSCGHVFCINCVPQSQNQCVVCKAEKSRFLEINQNSKPDIKAYFMDPMAVLRENLKQYAQVLSFQKAQAKSYQGCLAKMYDAYNSKVQEVAMLQRSIEQMNREKAELQRKIDEMVQEHQSWMGNRDNFLQPRPPNQTPVSGRNNQMIFSDMRNTGTPSDAGTPFVVNMAHNDNLRLFSPTPSSVVGRNGLITPGGPAGPSGGVGGRRTPGSAGSGRGSGNGFVTNGRVTTPRTPQDMMNVTANVRRMMESQSLITPGRPESGRPSLSQMPNSGRSSDRIPSQDIVTRLRQLQRPSMCESSQIRSYKRN